MDVLRKKLCALIFRKMHTKSEKNINKLFCRFLLIRMERNAHITSNLVYCSVRCVFLFQISYIEGPGSATIKKQNIIIQRRSKCNLWANRSI